MMINDDQYLFLKRGS